MKILSILSAAVLLQGVCYGDDSAYQALRILGKERTQALLNRVIQVQGLNGAPQPQAWKIVLDDPAARGGVREFEVQKGRIVSERTPVNAYSGASTNAVMDFKKLNLDSIGAFTVAVREATTAHVGFDSVNYTLRCGDGDNAPVWILKLLDDSKHEVGTIFISADTGVVIQKERFGSVGNSVNTADVGTTVTTGSNVTQPPVQISDNPDDNGESKGVGGRIKQGFIKAGTSIHDYFLGHHSSDDTSVGD